MAKYYSWTNFVTERNEFNQPTKRVVPGDEVTASSLGVTDEQFQEYIQIGAVRTVQHPDMGNFMGSPVEWYKEQAANAGDYLEQMRQLQQVAPAEVTPTTEEASKKS